MWEWRTEDAGTKKRLLGIEEPRRWPVESARYGTSNPRPRLPEESGLGLRFRLRMLIGMIRRATVGCSGQRPVWALK